MNNQWRSIFTILGIIAAIYLIFRYIIPIVFKMLGWVIGAALYIVMWIAIGFFVVILFGYIVRMIKSRQ